jgi:protein-tyrosine phosphatase
MGFRSVALPGGLSGRLWLASMPGRWEPWPDFVEEAGRVGLGLIVCLTEAEEIDAASPRYRAAIEAGELPGRWLHVPVRNFGVPEDAADFRVVVEAVAEAMAGGESVLLHCAAGQGRTGTTAACVLKRLGLPAAEALRRVRDAGSNPQGALQAGLVDWF